jgi:hypothetical protein
MRSAATLLLLLCASGTALAQPPRPTVPFDGVEVFAHILYHVGKLKPVAASDAFEPARTAIIVFGDMRVRKDTALTTADLARLAAAGGSLLIACDRANLWNWSVELGEPIRVAAGGYRDNPDCPLLHAETLQRTHPLFLGLQRGLATNSPRALKPLPGGALPVLARVPAADVEGWLDNLDDAARPWLRGPARIVAGALGPTYMVGSPAHAPPEARTLVLGGHGMFMNCMLVQPDCDNFAFACNCIHWLRAGPGGRDRSHALFIVDGKVVEHFNPSLTPPMPVPSAALLDQLLTDLEDERFLQRLIESEPDVHIGLLRGLLIAATLSLVLYSVKKLLAGRHTTDTIRLPAPDDDALVLRRRDELMASGNLAEAAQALARSWFHEHAGLGPESWFGATPAVEPVAAGPFWRRWQLERQLRRLWDLAAAATPARRVSPRELLSLRTTMTQLSAAVQEHRLEIHLQDETPARPAR